MKGRTFPTHGVCGGGNAGGVSRHTPGPGGSVGNEDDTPIGVSSSFPTLPPGPGVWRLTPPAFPPPQTPWVGNVRPFILLNADQFLPDPPPSLQSSEWVEGFNQIKTLGELT